MKKFLVGIISLSLLLSSCKPHDVRLAERCLSSTVLIHMKVAKGTRRAEGTCSGVYVTPNLILTADHCVDMSMEFSKDVYVKEIWIRNSYDRSARATVVKMSVVRDLALLKTDLKGNPVQLAKDIQVGEECWVVGQPLGLQFIVSKGIVSQTNVPTFMFPVNHFITTATVLPGNSGGPAFNSKGQLIGIVTMSTSMLGSFGAAGLGIAVQIDEVRSFLRHVK